MSLHFFFFFFDPSPVNGRPARPRPRGLPGRLHPRRAPHRPQPARGGYVRDLDCGHGQGEGEKGGRENACVAARSFQPRPPHFPHFISYLTHTHTHLTARQRGRPPPGWPGRHLLAIGRPGPAPHHGHLAVRAARLPGRPRPRPPPRRVVHAPHPLRPRRHLGGRPERGGCGHPGRTGRVGAHPAHPAVGILAPRGGGRWRRRQRRRVWQRPRRWVAGWGGHRPAPPAHPGGHPPGRRPGQPPERAGHARAAGAAVWAAWWGREWGRGGRGGGRPVAGGRGCRLGRGTLGGGGESCIMAGVP